MEPIVITQRETSLLSTHKVLRNTYFLLGLTLAFSAAVATTSMLMGWPRPGMILTLVGFYGLFFLTQRYANSAKGLVATFALTGFMGYTLGPLLGMFLKAGAGDVILTALGGTALVFFSCSAYVLTTRKDMSFMGGMLTAGAIALLVLMVAGIFLQMPAMHLAISALFVLFSSGMILFETSNIIHGGETNYIRATVSLYVSLYNLFVSLLSILGIMRDE
ncbi:MULTISPECIES: Bax inhibitor-1 family protein [Plesiomonas]|jgi:modulator of FtsH protease|uniref:Bax inhibitor-1 family protein n=1 Tax=Plesiomonas shigelloides TaxID=703 RepID=A0A1A9AWI2_PLESH|nr:MULTISPECIES: Bax inhibitor-1 family protein [Plesiomonas]AVQ86776.1 BAX inhibitor protein [Plesiomonas shigelloides]KAB7659107.1 FtsH protease modulator YccA [Plesiomonas shigelloides]KAB7665338.1 FtsH protease modulator YccA [Plesiomonas shigelloides]KAB7666740.1 FtsH protease modulator YccA [Plesiomonas shigelloides]KAB7678638.1 FtsH protease modulator YccA [Plesiomonas shigelloides]